MLVKVRPIVLLSIGRLRVYILSRIKTKNRSKVVFAVPYRPAQWFLASKTLAATQVKLDAEHRIRVPVLVASVLGLLLAVAAGAYGVANWIGIETGEPPAIAKQPSGLSRAEFQKREVQKFLGRWIAVKESTAEGGRMLPKVVSDRAFTITVRPNCMMHRRNPTLTETTTIRGEVQSRLARGGFFSPNVV